MANAPSNSREGDGKEHHDYSDEYKDPIQDMPSSGIGPMVAMGSAMTRSEQLDLLEHNSDDKVVSPTSIAQPMTSSSSSEVEAERYSQSPSDPANKMKVAT